MSFTDPVAVRHALEMLSELAARDPYAVAMSLGYFMLTTFLISPDLIQNVSSKT